jgi:hypothetical protein
MLYLEDLLWITMRISLLGCTRTGFSTPFSL